MDVRKAVCSPAAETVAHWRGESATAQRSAHARAAPRGSRAQARVGGTVIRRPPHCRRPFPPDTSPPPPSAPTLCVQGFSLTNATPLAMESASSGIMAASAASSYGVSGPTGSIFSAPDRPSTTRDEKKVTPGWTVDWT